MRKWYPLVLFAATMIVSLVAYPRLPERVPSHWDIHGQVNGYAPRGVGVFLMPLVLLAMWGLFRVLPRIDPRRANYAKMQGAYDLVVNAALTILAVIHVATIAAMFGSPQLMPRLLPVAVGVLFVVIGNVLPKARPNWFFGIRTPWTLSNDRVWERTHRVGGYLMVAAGIIGIVSAALPFKVGFALFGVMGAIAGVGSLVYSYYAWKQETSK